MTAQLPREIRKLIKLQCGIVTSTQLAQSGLTKNMVNSKVRYGRWQRLYRGAYATFSGQPGRPAVLWAAVLSAGPGAMLSYGTAAELGRLADTPSELIHLTVPWQRRVVKVPVLVVHYSSRAGQARHPVLLPPQTRIEETVLDLAGAAISIDSACSWVTRSLGRRLTTQAKLRAAMDQRAKLRWRPQLAELLTEDAAGLHSILERRYHRDVERPHGLPSGKRQAPFKLDGRNAYRDRLYRTCRTAVELDGRAAHPGDARWKDIHRDNAAAADGIITLRYGWLDVTVSPCQVAAEVARALALRGFTGARPCSADCPVAAVARPWRPPA